MGSASAKPEISPIEGNFKVIEEVEPKKEKTLKTSEENVESKDEGNTNEVDGVRPTIQEVDELGDVLEDGTEPRVISEQVNYFICQIFKYQFIYSLRLLLHVEL